jgi:hypothetical protein
LSLFKFYLPQTKLLLNPLEYFYARLLNAQFAAEDEVINQRGGENAKLLWEKME